MSHTFLSLDMALIPQATKDNVPTFWMGMFSSDGIKAEDGLLVKEPLRMLIDGKNDKGEMVHTLPTLRAWTQWSSSPDEVILLILDSAIEYTTEQIKLEQQDSDSIWYINTSEFN